MHGTTRAERRVRAPLSRNQQSRYVIKLPGFSPTCAKPSTDSSAVGCSNSEGVDIGDTIEVNTSDAETTWTDQQATQLREPALALESQAAHVAQPVGDRLRAAAARFRDQAGKHDRTRITIARDGG